jgi:hypothetical protein
MSVNRLNEQREWLGWLEIAGAEIFLRYRKRLKEPGILLVMRHAHPELSYPDLAVRLFAARQLVESGNELIALRSIRSGEFRQMIALSRGCRDEVVDGCGDRISALLVGVGGFLASCFVSLVMLATFGLDGPGAWAVATVVSMMVWFAGRQKYRFDEVPAHKASMILPRWGVPWCHNTEVSRCSR